MYSLPHMQMLQEQTAQLKTDHKREMRELHITTHAEKARAQAQTDVLAGKLPACTRARARALSLSL
jgi:hypothetical protein